MVNDIVFKANHMVQGQTYGSRPTMDYT